MTDEFEFTLNSSLTKEDWDKLTDVELENTMSITFQTPQGRRVKYIKCEVLDEIRNEITMLRIFNRRNVIEIIDKQIAESEVQE